MRFARRLMPLAAASTLIAAGLTGCSSDEDKAGAPIVIGADLVVDSPADTAYENALNLKVEQLNSSRALGDRRVELRILRNRNDPAESQRNIAALAADPAVSAVITGTCSDCVIQAGRTISDAKLPIIALAPANEVAAPVADRRYVFRIGPNARDSADTLSTELNRKRAKSAAIYYTDDLYGRSGKAAVETRLKALNIPVKGSAAVSPGASDARRVVTGLVAGEPDALIVITPPEQATLVATTAKGAGFKGRLYFDANAASNVFIPGESAAAFEDSVMVSTQILAINDIIATTPAKAARKRYFQDYSSKFGGFSSVAAYAGDAVDLIAGALETVGSDRAQIRDVLETSGRDGLSGLIQMSADDHSGLRTQAFTLLVARSGRWRVAS